VGSGECAEQLREVTRRDLLLEAARVHQKVKELPAGRKLESEPDDVACTTALARIRRTHLKVVQSKDVRMLERPHCRDLALEIRELSCVERCAVDAFERDLVARSHVRAQLDLS
jgi:hypothetical protein